MQLPAAERDEPAEYRVRCLHRELLAHEGFNEGVKLIRLGVRQGRTHAEPARALLREHLAWIETEIARETASGATAPSPTPVASTSISIAPAAQAEADALLAHYAAEEKQNPDDLRRGCFIVFFLALALIASAVTVAWLLFYR